MITIMAIVSYSSVFPLQPCREPLHHLTSHEAAMHTPTAP
jgi:hypothetical protein